MKTTKSDDPQSNVLNPNAASSANTALMIQMPTLGRWEAICLIGLLALIVGPLLWPVATAVVDKQAWHQFYWDRQRNWGIWSNTCQLLGIVAVTTATLSYSLALLLFRLRWSGQSLCLWLLLTTAFTPLVFYVSAWQSWIGPNGWYRPPLTAQASVGGFGAVALLHVLAALPWTTALVGVGLRLSSPTLEEQGLLDGSVAWTVRQITLPQIWPFLLVAALYGGLPVLTDMTIADLFRIPTVTSEVYQYLQLQPDGGDHVCTLLILPCVLPVTILLALGFWRLLHFQAHWEWRVALPLPWDRSCRRWVVISLLVALCYFFLWLGLLRQLGWQSHWQADGSQQEFWSFALAGRIFARQWQLDYSTILHNLLQALGVGLVSVLLASYLSWCWWRCSFVGRALGLLLIAWACVLPGPIIGFSLITSSQHLPVPIYGHTSLMYWGQMLRALPICCLIFNAALLKLQRPAFEMAQWEGITGFALVKLLIWPALAPVWPIAILLSAAIALAELPITYLTVPPGADPLVLRLFSLIHTGTTNEQAALGLNILLLASLLAALAVWQWKIWPNRI